MFTTLKVRAKQPAGDYRDGDFAQPPGTQAYDWQGAPANTPRTGEPGTRCRHITRKPSALGFTHTEYTRENLCRKP